MNRKNAIEGLAQRADPRSKSVSFSQDVTAVDSEPRWMLIGAKQDSEV